MWTYLNLTDRQRTRIHRVLSPWSRCPKPDERSYHRPSSHLRIESCFSLTESAYDSLVPGRCWGSKKHQLFKSNHGLVTSVGSWSWCLWCVGKFLQFEQYAFALPAATT